MLRSSLVMLLLCGGLAADPVRAADKNATETFAQDGVVLEIAELFPAVAEAMKRDRAPGAAKAEGLAGRAFVSNSGVYAFLETPENQKLLAPVKSGSRVSLTGKLLKSGALLHVDRVTAADGAPVDLKKYREQAGQAVSLEGTNLCQCGLNVGDLPHSCTLGHLHHLQTKDGTIYHYLPVGDGQSAFLGKGSHFKPVAARGRLFPGNFLLVEQARVLP